jgi:Flp pilus assembly pilin Flp
MRLLDQKGQGLTEYLVLLLLIAIVSIAATKSLGGTIKRKIEEAERHVNSDLTIRDSGSGGGGLFGR